VQHEEITLRGAPLRVFGQAAYIRVTMQKYKQLDLNARHKIKLCLMQAIHKLKSLKLSEFTNQPFPGNFSVVSQPGVNMPGMGDSIT